MRSHLSCNQCLGALLSRVGGCPAPAFPEPLPMTGYNKSKGRELYLKLCAQALWIVLGKEYKKANTGFFL